MQSNLSIQTGKRMDVSYEVNKNETGNSLSLTSEEEKQIMDEFIGNEYYAKAVIDLLYKILNKPEQVEILRYLNNLKYIAVNFETVNSFAKLSIRLADPLGKDIMAVMKSTHRHWINLAYPIDTRKLRNRLEIVSIFCFEDFLKEQYPEAFSILQRLDNFKQMIYTSSNFNDEKIFDFMINMGRRFETHSGYLKITAPYKSDVYKTVSTEFLLTFISYANPIIIESAIKFIREKRPQLMPES